MQSNIDSDSMDSDQIIHTWEMFKLIELLDPYFKNERMIQSPLNCCSTAQMLDKLSPPIASSAE